MLIPVLGGPEEGGVSWIDEGTIAPMPLASETDGGGHAQLIKWHVDHILAGLARAARAASRSAGSLLATIAHG